MNTLRQPIVAFVFITAFLFVLATRTGRAN